jgi:hypothetical protein
VQSIVVYLPVGSEAVWPMIKELLASVEFDARIESYEFVEGGAPPAPQETGEVTGTGAGILSGGLAGIWENIRPYAPIIIVGLIIWASTRRT